MRYPIEQMHAAARQIAAAADSLGESTTSFLQQAQDSTSALPPSVRDAAWGSLSQFSDHLFQLLDLQHSLADHLNASATFAAAIEQGATGAFDEKP